MLASAWWIARTPSAIPSRLHVIERLVTPVGSSSASPASAARRARERWSAAQIESSWTRVQSGTSATLRSPRLELAADFHSIAVTRAPAREPFDSAQGKAATALILWSDAPKLEGSAFARNRRDVPASQDAATLVIDAEALQSDQRRPLHYLFLHLPDGGAVADAIESIAIITARDLATAGATAARVAADGQTRDAFAATSPLTFRVTVPAHAEVTFGVRTPAGTPPAKVHVTQTAGGRQVFRSEIGLPSGRWQEVRTILREATDATLTLSTDAATQGAPAFWSVPLLWAPAASNDDRPNIIVIVVDALRADVIGAYGARQTATPFIDRLAAKSVLFQRAYAAASWTKPSIATLLTSLYPWTHALGARYYADTLPHNVPTLQSALAANGYVTAQFSANPFTSAASGLDRGFDAAVMAPALGHNDTFSVTAAALVDRFLGWAGGMSCTRYFAYLHLVDAHGARGIDGYRVAARRADTQIARLHSRLSHLPHADNTLVVITADHGEAFGDHGQHGHGQSVYEEEIRVPLIVREPRQTAGRVVEEPVHHVDVMPTLLDYAGIGSDANTLQGRSLRTMARLVHAPAADLRPSPIVATKFTYPEDVAVAGDRAEMHAIVDFPLKLIVVDRPGQPRTRELYRLDTDPAERTNVAGSEAARARQLETALDAFLRDQVAARARFTSTYERGLLPRPAPSRELVDQLRSLGYVR